MLTRLSLQGRSQELCALVQRARFSTSGGGGEGPLEEGLEQAARTLLQSRVRGANVYLIGNGGSAAIASHIANDLCNVAGIRALGLLDHAALTCFANDYGYENVYAHRIERMARPADVLLAVSSSGESENIVRAVETMRGMGGRVIGLSGFAPDNRLRALGDLNFWIDSDDYGLVEVAHLFMLHHLVDTLRLIAPQ